MDQSTEIFYNRYVQNGTIQQESPHSAISQYFHYAFKPGDRILDIGAGGGRDLSVLLESGFDAYGIEPNDLMREFSLANNPRLIGRLQYGSLPVFDVPFGGKFDGVVCSAVLMHISQADFLAAWKSIRSVLKPNGMVLMSVPLMGREFLQDCRDTDGRYFENYPINYIDSVLMRLGFCKIDLDHASIVKLPNITWTILMFKLSID